jgi:hypothetical protein
MGERDRRRAPFEGGREDQVVGGVRHHHTRPTDEGDGADFGSMLGFPNDIAHVTGINVVDFDSYNSNLCTKLFFSSTYTQ